MHRKINKYLTSLIRDFVPDSSGYKVYNDMLPKNILSGIYIEQINEEHEVSSDITGQTSSIISFYIVLSDEYSSDSSKIDYLEEIAEYVKSNFDFSEIKDSIEKITNISFDKINNAFIEEKNEDNVIYKIKIQLNYQEVK